ncbi:hypothetical protein Anas_09183 [Armadillidium nasatum]|uniref:Bromodomain protein 4 C-terminal domain-containing protein n=1 Tax=Armadillidium nasatum TaxID=96803 RepID=A0A5N5TP42_9CRUS|nr:hypothetical protein Anas_09183 [Armadillidium nasatum]
MPSDLPQQQSSSLQQQSSSLVKLGVSEPLNSQSQLQKLPPQPVVPQHQPPPIQPPQQQQSQHQPQVQSQQPSSNYLVHNSSVTTASQKHHGGNLPQNSTSSRNEMLGDTSGGQYDTASLSSQNPQMNARTSRDSLKYEDQVIQSELQMMMMRDSMKMSQNYSRQTSLPVGGNSIPHSAVSNGFSSDNSIGLPTSGDHGLGGPVSSVGGSLSHMPAMSVGNLPLSSVGSHQSLLQNISMMNSSLDELSSASSLPYSHNSVMPSLHDISASHMGDGNLPDLKMAGLETSLGYNFGTGQMQSMSQDVSGGLMHQQSHHQPQGSVEVASLQNYINVQKKSISQSLPETPKMSMSNSGSAASLNKAKVTPKNLSSWSSLAQSSANPANPSPSLKSANDSFAQFRKAAKEKAAKKQQMMEQQELRRQQKEAVEKERARAEQDRERARREEELLEKAMEQMKEKEGRLSQDSQRREIVKNPNLGSKIGVPSSASSSPQIGGSQSMTPTPLQSPHISTPSPSVDPTKLSDRDRQKLREQERRRREAMAGKIDMNHQSDLMAEFEEQCGK